jgi:hypothetical protein
MIQDQKQLEAVKIKCSFCGAVHICNVEKREECGLEWLYRPKPFSERSHEMDARQAAR